MMPSLRYCHSAARTFSPRMALISSIQPSPAVIVQTSGERFSQPKISEKMAAMIPKSPRYGIVVNVHENSVIRARFHQR